MTGQHTIAQTQRKLGSAFDPSASHFTTALNAAYSKIRNEIERGPLANAKLSWSAYRVLWIVWSWESIETREIAAEADLGKPAVSGVLGTLERRGLISRKAQRSDSRLVEVKLTAVGKNLFEKLFKDVTRLESQMVADIASTNRTLLTDLLNGIAG